MSGLLNVCIFPSCLFVKEAIPHSVLSIQSLEASRLVKSWLSYFFVVFLGQVTPHVSVSSSVKWGQ